MIDVPVSAVMTEAVPTVSPDTTAAEAASHLRRADVHAVVVAAGDGVEGIVTESDVVAVVAEGGGNPTVDSFMSSPVVTISPTTPVGLAADRMRDAGVTCLPVVDGAESGVPDARPESGNGGRPLGLVTRADIAPYLSRHRLDVDWEGDPLSLDGTGTPERSAE
ncbi:CBS domain-containing protein [Haloplanus rubicundus]|uniref:CBS domain-containing protein n=1 Tax=Haloplanus rubicundus TaxID=1547898 RepID=A0A345E5J5_9EURY|nr:CBS domain-containing protein [Haloplanus rubicundus]AXG07467.1 CBS domain-containing protein [Haloplanus rubicundus]